MKNILFSLLLLVAGIVTGTRASAQADEDAQLLLHVEKTGPV